MLNVGWDDDELLRAEKEKRLPLIDPPPISWYYQMYKYSIKFFSILDLISIFPFYVSFITPIQSLIFFRIFRLTRLTSLLKVSKSKEYANLVKRTIKLSVPILRTLSFYVALLMILYACLVYIVERGEFTVNTNFLSGAFLRPDVGGISQAQSPFQSISDSLYFVIITTTTIGYGDLYPTTQIGRLLACFFVYSGIIITAFPIAIIGQNFVSEYTKMIDKNLAKNDEERAALLTDYSSIPPDINSEQILLEATFLLRTLLNDTSHLSRHSETLKIESKKLSCFSSLLKKISSPPGDWDCEE